MFEPKTAPDKPAVDRFPPRRLPAGGADIARYRRQGAGAPNRPVPARWRNWPDSGRAKV